MARKPDVQYIRFYTDGSTAREVAPMAPLKTLKLPKIRRHKRITLHIDPIAIAGIVMAAVMLVLMLVGMAQLLDTRQQLQTMQDYVQTLEQENGTLKDTYLQGYDLEAIEQTALALGYVPVEQVKHVTVQLPQVQQEQEPGAFDRFYTFLTGLFA